jgi:hypothetical protein
MKNCKTEDFCGVICEIYSTKKKPSSRDKFIALLQKTRCFLLYKYVEDAISTFIYNPPVFKIGDCKKFVKCYSFLLLPTKPKLSFFIFHIFFAFSLIFLIFHIFFIFLTCHIFYTIFPHFKHPIHKILPVSSVLFFKPDKIFKFSSFPFLSACGAIPKSPEYLNLFLA